MTFGLRIMSSYNPMTDQGGLEYDFYRTTCPQAESIVNSMMTQTYSLHKEIPPQLLRLFFHDCFIKGCHASVFLDDRNGNQSHTIEKQARVIKLDEYQTYLRTLQKEKVTESGKQECQLVATVGKFSMIWDFQQVKNSAHECYQNQQCLKSCYCYKIVEG